MGMTQVVPHPSPGAALPQQTTTSRSESAASQAGQSVGVDQATQAQSRQASAAVHVRPQTERSESRRASVIGHGVQAAEETLTAPSSTGQAGAQVPQHAATQVGGNCPERDLAIEDRDQVHRTA